MWLKTLNASTRTFSLPAAGADVPLHAEIHVPEPGGAQDVAAGVAELVHGDREGGQVEPAIDGRIVQVRIADQVGPRVAGVTRGWRGRRPPSA